MVDTVGFVPLPKSSADDTNTEPPVLVLDSFAPRTIVDFGDVSGKFLLVFFTDMLRCDQPICLILTAVPKNTRIIFAKLRENKLISQFFNLIII